MQHTSESGQSRPFLRVHATSGYPPKPTAVLAGSPLDFGKLVVDETEKWAKVVKLSGARPG
jgi:hypothetical protein